MTGFFNAYFKTGSNALIYFKKPGQFLFFNFINFVATIGISLWGLFYFPNTLYGPISGRFFSGVIIFILALYIFKSHSAGGYEKKFTNDLVKFCAPFFLYVISSWILGNIDRYFLKTHISAETLAAYDLLLKCYFGIEFLQNSLSAIIFPKLFEIWSKHHKLETTPESNRYFNVFTAINILMLAGFCIIIPLVIKLFIRTEQYYTSFDYIGLIAGGYATRSILNFYLSTILFSKKNWQLVKIFGFTAIFQITVTYFLVRQFDLTGALYAGIATKVMQVICSAIFTKGIFEYNFNVIKIYLLPFLYLITNVACFVFFPNYNFNVYVLQFAVFTLTFFLIFKNEIGIVIRQYFPS
jgi:O-antigen/teichoic acid export membrane protein